VELPLYLVSQLDLPQRELTPVRCGRDFLWYVYPPRTACELAGWHRVGQGGCG
jgi:hypothetical protein